MNQIDVKFDRPVVLQGFALSLDTLEKPSILHITEYAIFVVIKCHVAIELGDSVDRLSLLNSSVGFTEVSRQILKRGCPYCLILYLSK
jgi:hypothetical protein